MTLAYAERIAATAERKPEVLRHAAYHFARERAKDRKASPEVRAKAHAVAATLCADMVRRDRISLAAFEARQKNLAA